MFSENVIVVIFTVQLPASATGVAVIKAAAAITTVIITGKMTLFMPFYASYKPRVIDFGSYRFC